MLSSVSGARQGIDTRVKALLAGHRCGNHQVGIVQSWNFGDDLVELKGVFLCCWFRTEWLCKEYSDASLMEFKNEKGAKTAASAVHSP